jgi:hypothetical protein
MDRERIATSVIASVITAAALYIGALVFDFFTVSLDPTDVSDVAREFINDDDAREALLRSMAKDEEQRFRGPQGDRGAQGPPGESGEAPNISLQFFKLSSAKDNPASESATLGEHQFCSLSRVHLPHASQACGCILQQQNEMWSLDLATDATANGACRCTAMCANW